MLLLDERKMANLIKWTAGFGQQQQQTPHWEIHRLKQSTTLSCCALLSPLFNISLSKISNPIFHSFILRKTQIIKKDADTTANQYSQPVLAVHIVVSSWFNHTRNLRFSIKAKPKILNFTKYKQEKLLQYHKEKWIRIKVIWTQS